MRSLITLATLLGAVLAAPGFQKRDCSHDNCLRAFIRYGTEALALCAIYEPGMVLPDFAASPCTDSPVRVVSACACVYTASVTSSSSTMSTSTSASSSTSTTSTWSSSSTSTTSSTSSTSSSTSTISTPSSSSTSTTSTSSSTSSSTTSPTSITSTSITTSSTSSTSSLVCTASTFPQIATAVAACTAITLQDIAAPMNGTIDLSKLKSGAVVTFAGKTTFAFTNSSTFNPIMIGGKGITITAASGAIIDGNGQAYWDGQGSNGGVPKPDHFIVVNKVTQGSVIENLHIQNWPTHLFYIESSSDLTLQNLYLDNSAGDAPNAISGGLPAAHNTDGFDVSSCNNTLIQNSQIYNQDDCVAITSGIGVTVNNLYCSGGHGLSIGSVGGKSNNVVQNILFENSAVVNSQNGPRIKSNYNTTGLIQNVTYSNIALSGISVYGIDVQQDYLNGGPTGIPSNGVIIENLTFSNVTGTAVAGAQDYYILCGSGSCSSFVFNDVSITGGTNASSCNYPPSGCPAAD